MADDDYGKQLVRWGVERWHSTTGLAAVIAGTIAGLVLLFAGIDLSEVSRRELALIGAVVVVVVLAWLGTRIKKVKRGRVGLGVAILFDDVPETKQLRADFVDTLRNLTNAPDLKTKFDFVEFSQTLARRVFDDSDGAAWLSRKSGISLLIYGRARVRSLGGEDRHVLELKWLVRHAPISRERSGKLAEHVRPLLPTGVNAKVGDIFACELAARLVDAGSRYVIATLASLAGEYEHAETLLLTCEATLVSEARNARGTSAVVMLERVRGTITENYLEWGRVYLARYSFRNRDQRELADAEPIFAKLRGYAPDNYATRLFYAMYHFLTKRDIGAARRELNQCRTQDDGAWMYSEAFLLGYEGDLDSAYKMYRKAFAAPVEDESVVTQCEEFIQGVLQQEPDKSWLHYCSGLINFRAKEDWVAARNDFVAFAQGADVSRFGKQLKIVKDWISEIDAALNRREPE